MKRSLFDERRAADRGFRAIDWRKFSDMQHTQTADRGDPPMRTVHTLTAKRWRSRRRIAVIFLWLGWRILTRGRVTIKF